MTGRFPHVLAIIIASIILAWLATYVVPQGEYERKYDPKAKREVVVSGTYHRVKAKPLSLFDMVVCIPRGIVEGGEVIVTIFLIGACFYVVEKTGALKQGIMTLIEKFKGREEVTLIITGLFFLIGGALEGLEEEVIPLTPAVMLLASRLGYSSLVTIAISYGSAVIGASFSPLNPFGAVLAQKVAEIPFLTSAGFQVIVLFSAFSLWMFLVIRYGNKNRLERQVDSPTTTKSQGKNNTFILLLVGVAFVIMVYGLMSLGWGFNEMSAEFFVVGILIGLLGGLGINGTCVAYIEGMRQMTFAALIIGFAHSISIVLQDGKILDTIIYGLFVPLQGLGTGLSSLGMMISQSILHILIPSYSGQALLTMPILVPLSDLMGLSRQVAVLAFQYGAILMNMISPTNGSLMAILVLSGVSYDKWFVFAMKRMILIFILGALAILVAGVVGV